MIRTQVLILGGGPGGSTSALYLRRAGIDAIIVEKEQFPRYHIGESMTGECGALVRELGLEEKMLRAGFPVKRGLTVYSKAGRHSWFVPVMSRDQDNQLRPQSTWQVRRDEFDHMLLDEALERGAGVVHGRAVSVLQDDKGRVTGARIQPADGKAAYDIHAEVVLDCSEQFTFLANAGVTGEKFRGNYDKQIAIFSQVTGAVRDDGDHRDDTLIFYQDKYHWSWFIPLDADRVSVGVVCPSAYFLASRESREAFLARELRELNPELSTRMQDISFTVEVRAVVNYSYQVRDFCGPGFLCVGYAHRFIDPIFSFGLYASMKEARVAAQAVSRCLGADESGQQEEMRQHQRTCDIAMDIVEDTVDTFWEYPLAFAMFAHKRYPGEMIDILAGRVFDNQPSVAVNAMRRLINRDRGCEGSDGMPSGSRYRLQ